MKKLALIIFLYFNPATASDWFCREAASQRLSERLFQVCGTYKDESESVARKKSLNMALEEFSKLCMSSSSCKNKEVEILPKRTDCTKKSDDYICYRMVEVVVLRHDRKAINIDEAELDSEIKKKKRELDDLHSKLSKLAQIKRLEKETTKLKELEQKTERTEIDLINLEQKLRNAPEYMDTSSPWRGAVFLSYFNVPIDGMLKPQFGLGIGATMNFNTWLSIGSSLHYFSDFDEKKVESSGPANGTLAFPQSSSGWLLNLDVGFEINSLRIAPMYVHYKYSKEVVAATYSPLGIKTGEQTTNVSGSNNGYGLKASYNFKYPLIEVVVMNFNKQSLSYGINIGVQF